MLTLKFASMGASSGASGGAGGVLSGTYPNPGFAVNMATQAELDAAITGGGVVATGGFTLTIPATGTAALLAANNAFTGTNSFGSASTWGGTIAGGASGWQFQGQYGGSSTGRALLKWGGPQGGGIVADVGASTEGLWVSYLNGAGNARLGGYFASNTAFSLVVAPMDKAGAGGYTGAGHILDLRGGVGSNVTTGAAGGKACLTGGAAAGSGNNNGGNVEITGGAKTGSGTVGVVLISSLPTSNPGPGILWNNAGTPAIGT